ncbi:MAG: zinc transporter ZntB [Rickettsiales bacterium]|nr:zinc transporter ZntB [Rickettsiales bacterium]
MAKHSPILFSYAFDAEGKPQKIHDRKASKEIENEGLAWAHLDAGNDSAKVWLEKEVSYLDHLIVDALLAQETRPRVMEFSGGLLIILRSVNLNKNSEPDDMVSLRIWIDADRIITIQRREVKAVYQIADQLDQGKIIKNSGEFLYNLLYQILQKTSPFLYALNEKIDALEEKIMTTHDMKFREEILQIRTQSAVFKRYLSPQREVISKLRTINQGWIDDWSKRHFQENFDHITHLLEEADEASSRSQILHEELSNAMSERLNKSMYKLSMISIIFMPLTFVTGLFGMNVGGIPGSQNEAAFYICTFATLLVVLVHLVILKTKNRL